MMPSSSYGGNQIITGQPIIGQKNVHVTNSFVSHNNNNNTKMVQQATGSHPRSIGNMNNVYIQGSLQKVDKNSKYLVQQKLSHIILTPQQQKLSTSTTHQYHPPPNQQYHPQSPAGGAGGGGSSGVEFNCGPYRLADGKTLGGRKLFPPVVFPSANRCVESGDGSTIGVATGDGSTASGTIKYVNAQGNVITTPNNHRYRTILQQSLTTSQPQSSPSINAAPSPAVKSWLSQDMPKNLISCLNQASPVQVKWSDFGSASSNFADGNFPSFKTDDDGADIPAEFQPNSQHQHQSPTKQSSSTTPSSVDDIYVNGTHMSEEVSARILQSLSQKSVYNSSNNNINRSYSNQSTPQHTTVPVQNQTNHHYTKQKGQQRFYLTSGTNDYGSHSYQPHAIEQSNKGGPEYFRVK